MRDEITTIVFSKNRACQLDLLLRSINIPVSVIYTHTEEFKSGYDKLIGMYSHVKFIKQTDFKQNVIDNLGEYTMFLVDDDIMIRPLDNLPEFVEFKNNINILCLTLRLSPYFKWAPEMKNNIWEWRGKRSDWGYPMSVTSTIFRKADILPVIKKSYINMPNALEVSLRKNPPDNPFMMCVDKPYFVNNLANQVQKKYVQQNLGISLKYLEERFLREDRISLNDIKNKANGANTCFLKVPYLLENKNRWLLSYRKNITSQDGEDGIIKKIFDILEIKTGWCVDVGAHGMTNSNVWSLLERGWSGVLIENNRGRVKRLKKMYTGNNTHIIYATVCLRGVKLLDNLLKNAPVPKEFKFLNIDIDGNDYYIWESLIYYHPLVVLIEFNPEMKLKEYLQPYNGKGGSSLSMLIKLGKSKGYELISCTSFNAFFIRKELFDRFEIKDNSIGEMFIESNHTYG